MELDSVTCADLFDQCAALPDASIDLILCDLPYQVTANEWDELIPFEAMWAAFLRVAKPGAAIVLTASQPFTSQLVLSNASMFRYEWIWQKNQATGFLDANRKPLKAHESVLVFCDRRAPYCPQMVSGEPYTTERKGKGSTNYATYGDAVTDNAGVRYPTTILRFDVQVGYHPTQKPVDLFRYLIRTYTQPGDIVFDPTCGSGTTAIAARAEARHFIVGDISDHYCAVTRDRLRLPFDPRQVKADNDVSELPLFALERTADE